MLATTFSCDTCLSWVIGTARRLIEIQWQWESDGIVIFLFKSKKCVFFLPHSLFIRFDLLTCKLKTKWKFAWREGAEMENGNFLPFSSTSYFRSKVYRLSRKNRGLLAAKFKNWKYSLLLSSSIALHFITPTRKNYAVQLLQIASWQARKNLNRINEFQVIGSDKVVLKPFYYSSWAENHLGLTNWPDKCSS